MKFLTIDRLPDTEYEVIGFVSETVAKARNAFSKLGSAAKSIVGGDIGGTEKLFGKLLEESQEGLKAKAEEAGATDVIGIHIEVSEIVDIVVMTIYGTMVKAK